MDNEKKLKQPYTCIECGYQVPELCRHFKGGNFKLSHCDNCDNVADKYIEYDPVLILLDALLHKPQAYRHILHNIELSWQWKLALILILCDTYQSWVQEVGHHGTVNPSEDEQYSPIFTAALELQFYTFFIKCAIELFVLLVSVILVLQLAFKFGAMDRSRISRIYIRRVWSFLVISSFGKLLTIPALIWGQSHSAVYMMLTKLFIFTSNVAALKVQYKLNRIKAFTITALGYTIKFIVMGLIAEHWT